MSIYYVFLVSKDMGVSGIRNQIDQIVEGSKIKCEAAEDKGGYVL